MFLEWIVLFSTVFTFGTTYNLYSTIDRWTGTKYDCIYTYISPQFFKKMIVVHDDTYYQPKEQIIPYCLTVKHFTVNEESCTINGGRVWNFEQLKKQNITGDDLIKWNATVNTMDEYERYL